ncbi:MAG: rod shape-determining protein MreC [Elusimicrobia bacterium]|nr:rod shape-determining protein MreC [Elusimicrobiota bacterium]
MNREKDMANYAFVFFVFLSALLLLFPSTRVAQTARIIASYSLYPSLHYGAKYDYYIRNVPENFLNLLKTDQENRALKSKIKELEISVKTARAAEAENQRLTGEMGLSRNLAFRGVWARVINKNPLDWYGSFFINKGAKAGITLNATVIGFETARLGLIGRVFEVYPDFSKVLLITNGASSVIGSVPGANFEGLAEGRGTWLLKVNYIPEGSDIAEGMELITSPSGLLFPPGLPVGRVARVHPKESFMNFITADVAPAISINSLKEVYVIKRDLPADLYGLSEGVKK